ncbi:phosphoribosyl-ATP diphosphatase [Oceanispirochaeta crateris]|nr:phosphoribosyl-ATP diphosphatase [Oceanispirochaeta crateris]
MSRGTVLALLIETENGGFSAALMDEKGFSKSREQGVLWVSHPVTGRILPFAGEGKFLQLEKRRNCYYALLPEGAKGEAYEDVIKETDIEEHDALEVLGEDRENNEILTSLSRTIQKRHIDMPAGSYTTHLFEKGSNKIRKKCGEEAIELVLASSPEDLVFESADLIYHMMVLLEAEGLSIQEVLAELKKRDS